MEPETIASSRARGRVAVSGDAFVPMIGLEVHAQLLTESKMFCGCSARYSGAAPNSHVCAVDLGLPGALPVPNARALDAAVMVGLALNCEIVSDTRFDRKNYPYPDIPKGFQISQYDQPLARNGSVTLRSLDHSKQVGIIRAHLEEDTGKTIHATVNGREVSLVDYNRAGVPLLEIVSEADMTTPQEARAYFSMLREILIYLGVSSGDMQEGALRADVNVSVRRDGEPPGVKVEIKNLNSFRAVERALQFEIDRQASVLASGGTLTQETRGWDESREVTISQRSKEFAEDYRYFPEPDLPPLRITDEHIDRIRAAMPELAAEKRQRYVEVFGLSSYDAQVLTQDPAVATLFDETVDVAGAAVAKNAANWLTGEFLRLMGEQGIGATQSLLTSASLAELIHLTESKAITTPIAKTVFAETFATGQPPAEIVQKRGLSQVSDRGDLEAAVRAVLEANPALVGDYVTKDRKTEGPLVGKVMAATRGRANPETVKQIMAEILLADRPSR